MVSIKQGFLEFGYLHFAKPVFFLFDPELMHRVFVKVGKVLGRFWVGRFLIRSLFSYQHPMLEQQILGIRFKNPVGLAAGFDKNAEIINIIGDVGFGFGEIGSVTAKSCKGNSGKRLERIIDKKGIWVNMGLNNHGADSISQTLASENYKIPYGVSIARTNNEETVDEDVAVKDYVYSARMFRNLGDFLVLNISCPNAYGGQPFSDSKRFEKLVSAISKLKISKPLFVKMSPDLAQSEIDKIIRLSRRYGIKGFICTNLTKDKTRKSGGYSGKMVEQKSDEVLEYIYRKTRGEFVLIGVGGIFSAEDAYRKIKLGANLVELVTGMIYQGPGLIGEINYDLCKLLKRDGYKNVGDAVGKGVN